MTVRDGISIEVVGRQLVAVRVGAHVVGGSCLLAHGVADEGTMIVFRQIRPNCGSVVCGRCDGLLFEKRPSLIVGVILEGQRLVQSTVQLHGDGLTQIINVIVVIPMLIDGEVHSLGRVSVGKDEGVVYHDHSGGVFSVEST